MLYLAFAAIPIFDNSATFAAEPKAPDSSVDRGYKALTETPFVPPLWSYSSYDKLWKVWEAKEKPANYQGEVQKRYGLHSAPFKNGELPMGLRKASFLIEGLTIDCMVCHAGSILGKSYIGLGNSSLDVHALFEDLNLAEGRKTKLPFTFSNARGTNEAGGMGVYLLGYREPDLKLRSSRKDLGLHDDLCEDVPAWWILKKKQTMYYTGGADARSVRSKMQFMMSPLVSRADFERHEKAFQDIDAFIKSVEAPKYPFPIDQKLADKGGLVFNENCAKCHGTYGEKWTYPNKIIPIEQIGTDRKRFDGITAKFGEAYNESWFSKEKGDGYLVTQTKGYQAPPLDGIWATAPYLHNGSVPTLYALLKSDVRPKLFTRSFETNEADYDRDKVGWKITEVKSIPMSISVFEQRKYYDTSKPGRSNRGHTFGDDLTEGERKAVLEYLKTL
ncbi:hypothetical protein KIH39_05590 [Telmatocola sphagniphila]|uniref:Cytochrome c domain-containing protein n=1 Tax=Telmatocola sphagniphila TaxID=1123043 RepID=A0A8E6BBJ8_9BACT|nr:hypothetical protein KIH39_05590 [Telmatocola sphagniphila]